MKNTTPVFILGTGRCGTFQMVKMLEDIEGIEAHHEYLFENILKPAILYRMGVIDNEEIKATLRETHVPAVCYADTPIWLDSSNALPWIIKPLFELFPNARFIHLLRDGRKVVSSFYNKFSEVMYDDRNVNIVKQWLRNPASVQPSPEKKYWRPFPMKGDKYFEEFTTLNRFQRLCYYWQDCNITIHNALEHVPDTQKLSIHLEDLVSNPTSLASFLQMFGVEYDNKYLQVLKRPVNVAIPKNFPLSEEERLQFMEIAGEAMKIFEYRSAHEYDVSY